MGTFSVLNSKNSNIELFFAYRTILESLISNSLNRRKIIRFDVQTVRGFTVYMYSSYVYDQYTCI